MKNINKKSKGEMKNILDEIRKQEQMFKEGYEIGVENERARIARILKLFEDLKAKIKGEKWKPKKKEFMKKKKEN